MLIDCALCFFWSSLHFVNLKISLNTHKKKQEIHGTTLFLKNLEYALKVLLELQWILLVERIGSARRVVVLRSVWEIGSVLLLVMGLNVNSVFLFLNARSDKKPNFPYIWRVIVLPTEPPVPPWRDLIWVPIDIEEVIRELDPSFVEPDCSITKLAPV